MRKTIPHDRRGFTLVEITLVTGLTVFLAVLLSSVWKSINGFTTDAVGRGQLMQEMDLAVASLSRDLGGSVPILGSTSFGIGRPDEGRWVGWQHPTDVELWLCYDGGTCPDGAADWSGTTDTVIRYYLAPDADTNVTTKVLVRENRSVLPYARFSVARNINSMTVNDDGGFVRIVLQFRYQQRSGATYFGPEYLRTFTLEAEAPQ
jgi:type II secretory pathway pseudopilin PulG